jgi:chemotaxis protein methyltransferase CheR
MNATSFGSVVMTDNDFQRISGFVQQELGIMMPRTKRTMLESRLHKRLRLLSINTFADYFDFVFSPEGAEGELIHMIDVVTTNKTEFFREEAHFNYLVTKALPELINLYGSGIKRKLMIWSAGCSTGEEPYTIGMVMQEFARKYQSLGFDHMILATDISTKVLDMAQNGIYSEERIAPIPMELRKKYLLRSKDNTKKLVRFNNELRSLMRFRRLNFMDDNFGFREHLDIIFCRNVVIYFDRKTQEKLFNKFYNQLTPGGYLFTGHSETLNGLDVPFVRVETAVYRKPL